MKIYFSGNNFVNKYKFVFHPFMDLKTPKARFLGVLISIDDFPPSFTLTVFDSC